MFSIPDDVTQVRIAASQRDPVDNPYNQVAAREVTETLLTSFYELERAAYARLGAEGGRGSGTLQVSWAQ